MEHCSSRRDGFIFNQQKHTRYLSVQTVPRGATSGEKGKCSVLQRPPAELWSSWFYPLQTCCFSATAQTNQRSFSPRNRMHVSHVSAFTHEGYSPWNAPIQYSFTSQTWRIRATGSIILRTSSALTCWLMRSGGVSQYFWEQFGALEPDSHAKQEHNLKKKKDFNISV